MSDRELYRIAQQVTDEVMGAGTYAQVNQGNPDPEIQRLIAGDPVDEIEQPPGPPVACPHCDGRGVTGGPDAFGNYDTCPLCEGSAIDPADPASPL